jgi:hypothetical protein
MFYLEGSAEMSVNSSQPLLAERPAYVPEELVRDVDLFNLPGARDDVHQAWKIL